MTRYVRSPMGIAVMVALFVVGAWATITIVVAVVPSTVFELEGDIDDDVADIDDWINNNCADPDASHADTKTGAVPDPFGQTIYTGGGSKDAHDIPDWKYKSGSVPPKDEIVNSYAARYGDVIVLGGERESVEGSANIGAWFFQNAIGLGTGTGGGGSPFTGTHVNGDILILAEFTIGGTVSDIRVLMWVASPLGGLCPDGNPCPPPAPDGNGVLADITASATNAEGFSNASPVTIPGTCPEWSYTDNHGVSGIFGINAFFEVGFDLEQLNLGNACFASFLLETRSSHEISAVLKDFSLTNFEACEVHCDKLVAPEVVCEGASATYTYKAINPAGADLVATMVDDNATDGNTSDDFCVVPSATPGDCQTFPSGDPSCPFALPGETTYECTRTIVPVVVGGVSTTYTNNVTISAEGPDPETCPATLVVHPNPVVTINSFACTFAPAFELCASPSGGTPDYAYSWAPTGDITQCTGLETATGSYTVTVTDANGCFDDATRNVGYCSD